MSLVVSPLSISSNWRTFGKLENIKTARRAHRQDVLEPVLREVELITGLGQVSSDVESQYIQTAHTW